MTKDEALKLALKALEEAEIDGNCEYGATEIIRKALAQPEPVKIAHKHEWFRTGEMKVGQMRCISCGTWGQEEIPQRTWVGLTDEDDIDWEDGGNLKDLVKAIEAKLKEKNT